MLKVCVKVWSLYAEDKKEEALAMQKLLSIDVGTRERVASLGREES